MTRGLIRIYGSHHLHFITFSTYRRLPTLTSERRDHVLEELDRVRQQKLFQVVGYVVMPEHLHLLIGEPQVGTPSSVVQLLKQRCAASFNATSGCKGSQFWQPRFYDFNILTHKKRVEKLKYMHNNPVSRGLVAHVKDWKWSSYAFYRDATIGSVLIDPS
jgi:putative transposase